MPDPTTKVEKMQAMANAPSASEGERRFARRWLERHGEPLTAPKPVFDPYAPLGSRAARARPTGRPMSDEARRRDETRQEAAVRKEAEERFRRETEGVNRDAFAGFGFGSSETPQFDFDDFLSQAKADFAEGFAEEMARRATPIYRADGFAYPRSYTDPTPEARRARAEEARLRREMADEMKSARRNVRQDATDYGQTRLREMREEKERAQAARQTEDVMNSGKGPRVDRDEGGNPIYRRRTG